MKNNLHKPVDQNLEISFLEHDWGSPSIHYFETQLGLCFHWIGMSNEVRNDVHLDHNTLGFDFIKFFIAI